MKKILLIIAAIFSVVVLVYATRPDSNGWIRMYYQCAHCGGSNTLTQHKNQTGRYCNLFSCCKCNQFNNVCWEVTNDGDGYITTVEKR